MKGLIVYNPTAGPREIKRELEQVRREMARRDWSVEIEVTNQPGDAMLLALQAAAANLDAVWVAGGDGTVNGVVNGLVGSDTALGVLPVGTGNIWAKQLHLPTIAGSFRLRESLIAQIEGRVRPVDVGQMGGRYFLLWAGVGFDAQVTREMEPRDRMTKQLGPLPYIIAAFILARDFSGVRTHMVLDGRAIRGRAILVLVSNTQLYGIFRVSHKARLDDGLLDVFFFKGLGFSYIFRHAAKMYSGRHLQDPKVVQRQARQVTLWTEKTMEVQADGDLVGVTPTSMSVVPRSLRVLVPPQTPASLFVSKEA